MQKIYIFEHFYLIEIFGQNGLLLLFSLLIREFPISRISYFAIFFFWNQLIAN